MKYTDLSKQIIENVGGVDNIVGVEHCSTRLRINLLDKSKANVASLEALPKVMKVINTAQCQIVIGGDVIEVYDAFIKEAGTLNLSELSGSQTSSKSEWLLDFVVGIFQPLVPAIAGAGVLKSLLLLLNVLGWLTADNSLYVVLSLISDATFFFLPVMVAITASRKLKSNTLVAVAAVGFLVLPQTTAMVAEGLVLFGMTVTPIAYNAQVFPAILSVIVLAFLEKQLNKVTPKSIRVFFVPMVALAITVPLTLLFLGPFGYNVGVVITNIIVATYEKIGFLALAVLGAILPYMIATGMHKAMIPYAVTIMGEVGYEALYLPASLAHNISEAGACFAIAIKTKDTELKSTAISSGISALMGITEPALYGVTLQNKKVMMGVSLSGAVGGLFLGLFSVQAFALVGPGLASITMFVDTNNPINLWYALLGALLSLVVSFAVVLLVWKDDHQQDVSLQASVISNLIDEISSPIAGTIFPLTDVDDIMFSSKAVGDGFAVTPLEGNVYAPCDGVVSMLFRTKHAIGIQTENNTELLIHIGIDTVQLDGKYFETFVEQGDKVKKGDLLISIDRDALLDEGYDLTTSVVVTNLEEIKIESIEYGNLDFKQTVLTTRGSI